MDSELITSKKIAPASSESLMYSIISPKTVETLGMEHIINILLSVLVGSDQEREAVQALQAAEEYLNAKNGINP
ncbi:hypothetical protein [Pseudomonas sp. SDO55104_S430]